MWIVKEGGPVNQSPERARKSVSGCQRGVLRMQGNMFQNSPLNVKVKKKLFKFHFFFVTGNLLQDF